MSEGKGNAAVSEDGGDVFRVFFRGVRMSRDGRYNPSDQLFYDYNDFFIVDILNHGLPVDDIIVDLDPVDVPFVEDDVNIYDDDDDDESEEEEEVKQVEEKEQVEEVKEQVEDAEIEIDDDNQFVYVSSEEEEEKGRKKYEYVYKESSSSEEEVDCGVNEDYVLNPFCEPLMNCLGESNTYLINSSSIYLVGSGLAPNHAILPTITYKRTGQSIRCLTSISRIDLDSDEKQWMLAPQPEFFGWSFQSATLGHNIYLMKTLLPDRCQLYDTRLNTWSVVDSAFPSHLQGCILAQRMIPDPDRNRILVHLSYGKLKTPTVYAWYPNQDGPQGESWVPLIPSLSHSSWKKKLIITDGLLLFYFRKTPQIFDAYDLNTNKWVRIKWTATIPDFLHNHLKAKSMFYMGNGQLCVAMSFPVPRPVRGSNVYFVFFDFSRSKKGTTISFRHTSMKLFYTRRICNTMDYLPLGDVR